MIAKKIHNIIETIKILLPLNRNAIIAITSAVIGVLTFFYFRQFEINENIKIIKNIEILLKNEINLRNNYALAKSIVDLEKLEIFSCAALKEENSQFIYYDTVSSEVCKKSLFFPHRIINSKLKSNNGYFYDFQFVKKPNIFSLIIEFFIYFILVVFAYVFPKYLYEIENKLTLKLKILEIEKSMLLDQAKIICHDVASPLSAIQMVIGLLKNVDPDIIEILMNSVKRTQSIFDDLKNSKHITSAVNIKSCVDEIINEKNLIWKHDCKIYSESENLKNKIVNVREVEFKRLVSNLLNNSYEAFESTSSKKIIVNLENQNDMLFMQIIDNGKGIPPDILKKIGIKGFSYGKFNHQSAGSGLGLYTAIELIESWGGNLNISSQLNKGTTITIQLKNI